ncbi:GntR family transcriptional regulator [Taklimakanibacter lacteus]|uniref:GntR family transcriptional regulator n=1 Tax=Taklimakanibacter lacteus TaxID=2268456 RepID=UPI000E66886A
MIAKGKSYDFLVNIRGEKRGGATARVTDALRHAIVVHAFEPGATLDKAKLCERLGVSRFPVSEALARLKAEGLVDIQPQRGSTVSLIRLSDVRENMFLRKALEVEAIRSIAPNVDAAILERLDGNVAAQKQAAAKGDKQHFHALDLSFHDVLLTALGFPRVKAAAESARLALDRVRMLLASPVRNAQTISEHERIVAALAQHDSTRAAIAMAEHLDTVMTELMSFARREPELFTDWQQLKTDRM